MCAGECRAGLLTSLGGMQVYHPNIDLDGNVCLNILREDWKPVLSISSIIYGLQFPSWCILQLNPLIVTRTVQPIC